MLRVGRPASRMAATARFSSAAASAKLKAPPMTYITGEEMTRYCMQLVLDKIISPNIDTSAWEFYDLSCKARDDTEDKVLRDAVASGARIGAIFKEPTVTPTEVQKKLLGLKKTWGSPNGAMRRGWNGITISRDTIHIEGMELGFKRPVLFERQAVGGEYSAGWGMVGAGSVRTVFTPKGQEPGGPGDRVIDARTLEDAESAVVTYTNPLDGVPDLAHIFFERCLLNKCTPYIVTKKTVFKWQEGFWARCEAVFNEHYKQKFLDAGLLGACGGQLRHIISDAACMQIIRWHDGGFGMACHNYDGDMLTDEVAQVHRSPGFINSSLIGKAADGRLIKEFEASHGTVADMWEAHLAGKETSLNPLGLVEALVSAMSHAADLRPEDKDSAAIKDFAQRLRKAMHAAMVSGMGTRDLQGPTGLTTEEFVDHVAGRLAGGDVAVAKAAPVAVATPVDDDQVDVAAMRQLFEELDLDSSGTIDFDEFSRGITRIGVAPRKHLLGAPKDKCDL
jgi:isocitrate dehydrogenase